MNRWMRTLFLVMVIAMGGLGSVPDARGQSAQGQSANSQAMPHRTLQIQDGTVYIDGTALPDEAVPDALRLDGVQMQYQVYGTETPIVSIQGKAYRLTASALEPVQGGGASDGRAASASRSTAEYMQMLRAQSEHLYAAVQREYALEHAAEQRAYRIRQMAPGPARTAHLDTLRQTVTQLFDLKQANRRRELQHLQQQVEALQQRMRERAAHRDAMIEQRIHQLTTGTP